MAERTNNTNEWPDLFVGLYDRLTGRNAEISYEFKDMEVDVPSSTADETAHANWKFNGTMRIKTRDHRK